LADLSDEKVGAVSGELCFEDTDRTGVGEGLDFYWNYEKFLRKNEAALYSTVGATGAIYAIRKSLFKPLDSDTLLDDVMIPMNIVMQGYRCVFEPKAKAFDIISAMQEDEKRRKIRTIAGNFQVFFRCGDLLNPFKNPIWFQTFSHKFLRIIAPIFIIALFISNLCLLESNFFLIALLLQIAFYACSAAGYLMRKRKSQPKIFSVPYGFVMLNVFTLAAFFQFIFNKPLNIWGKD
jgi:poly-beta-1,6-N-acetyl-D-glucosamine synthase